MKPVLTIDHLITEARCFCNFMSEKKSFRTAGSYRWQSGWHVCRT